MRQIRMHGLTWRGLETWWMTGLRETLDPKGEKRLGLTWSVLPCASPRPYLRVIEKRGAG